MKSTVTVIVVFLIIVAAWVFIRKPSSIPAVIDYTPPSTPVATSTPDVLNPSTSTTPSSDSIVIDTPKPNALVSSPVVVSGKARGNWFFEASAPVMVMDSSGKTLGQGYIEATEDWMTTNFVPFKGSISFTAPTGTSTELKLVFMNDNPSGDPERSVSVVVPIRFAR